MASNFKNLGYFTSVSVPDELEPTFKQVEDLLQQEHNPDGRHPIASDANAGFMSADMVKKLEIVWNYIQKLQNGG